MLEYFIELKMADKNLPITREMEELISKSALEASSTTVSRKYKRTFTIDARKDDYTLIIKLQSRDTINPTRTISTLTRAVTHNERLYSLVKNHIVNGLIFNTRLLSEQNYQIIHISDPDVVSEIVSIFFKNDFSPKEKELAEETAAKIRELVLDYKNKKLNL